MLRRERRIHTARDHQRVWQRGRVLRGTSVVVRVTPAQGPVSRFGFVVSSSIAKKATDRNIIKRRLRAIVRSVPDQPTRDVVVYATKRATTTTFEDLRADLLALLNSKHEAPSSRHH